MSRSRAQRLYYGWVVVGVLGVTETVSYGVLTYAFAVVLTPMQAEFGWPQAWLTGAFSLASLAAGVTAVPVGRWLDRYGPRLVMTAGSAAASLLVVAWSRVEHPVAFYAVWLGLGGCMAAVLYEPAFATVVRWFRRRRAQALTLVTLAGGMASPIFVPLTAGWVAAHGWRTAVLHLAATLALTTVLPHALLLRSRPADRRADGDGGPAGAAIERSVPARTALRSGSFRWLGAAFFLTTLAGFALSVHLVALLVDQGYPLAFASAAMAALGLAKLPGRLMFAVLAARMPASRAIVVMFVMQLIAIVLLVAVPGPASVWGFAALFGSGEGGCTPARAALLAERFGPAEYGQIGGTLALVLSAARAAAPVGTSLAAATLGGYGPVLWLLAALIAAAIGCVLFGGGPST